MANEHRISCILLLKLFSDQSYWFGFSESISLITLTEGAVHAYYNLVFQPCIACRDLGGAKLSARYAYFQSMSLDQSLKIAREYLIAAKDLSLVIS